MSRDGSVAPKERINIRYVPATGDTQEDVELPLSMMVVGDLLHVQMRRQSKNVPQSTSIKTTLMTC